MKKIIAIIIIRKTKIKTQQQENKSLQFICKLLWSNILGDNISKIFAKLSNTAIGLLPQIKEEASVNRIENQGGYFQCSSGRNAKR